MVDIVIAFRCSSVIYHHLLLSPSHFQNSLSMRVPGGHFYFLCTRYNFYILWIQLRSYYQSLVYSVADHSKYNKVLSTEFNCFFKNNYRNQHVYDSVFLSRFSFQGFRSSQIASITATPHPHGMEMM